MLGLENWTLALAVDCIGSPIKMRVTDAIPELPALPYHAMQ